MFHLGLTSTEYDRIKILSIVDQKSIVIVDGRLLDSYTDIESFRSNVAPDPCRAGLGLSDATEQLS